MNRRITAFNTHIEIFPYEYGEKKSIEDTYSVYDKLFHKMTPIAYTIKDDTLYLPRGTNLNMLEKLFQSSPIISKKSDPISYINIESILEPKSRIQQEAVEFLCSEGRFSVGNTFSQLSLNLDTGEGKTIASIIAISKRYKCKTLVIVDQTKLKNLWKKEFIKASTVEENRIFDIVGSDGIFKAITSNSDFDIFLTTHQTLHQFGTSFGWNGLAEFFKNLNIGVKIYDEAHKYFSNICMIDFFSNTDKTLYLTATFTRNNSKERMMYKKVFANTYRFGEETLQYEEKRKHTIYYYVTFNSYPEPQYVAGMYGLYSISSYKYIDYAFKIDENQTLLKVLSIVYDKVKHLRGRILIISPKIESTEYIADFMKKITNKEIAVVNSNKSNEDNENAKTADIISSTMKSLGTGVDIKGLRVIINMEPFTSQVNMRQLKGRLREFSKSDDTYLFDLVDIGIRDIEKMGEKRKAAMKPIQKEMREWKL